MTQTSKPHRITLIEHSNKAFAIAAALVRDGYIFDTKESVETFFSGEVVINLVLGELDPTAIASASIFVAKALELQQARSEQAAALALASTVVHQAKEAAKAILAKEIAESKARVKALEKQLSKA